jgi:hypothetical protein
MQSGSAECVFASVAISMPWQVILCQCRPRRYGWNSHFKNAGRRQAGGRGDAGVSAVQGQGI